MAGKLYGVGVGPGDPELLTLKALRVIRESGVIIVPGADPEKTVAYEIAVKALPEIADKTVIGVEMPMTKNKELLEKSHEKAVASVRDILEMNQQAAFLTLGDPCIYSTYAYIHKQISRMGYETEIINGIPSFLAVSARFNDSLTEQAQMLHIIPATYQIDEALTLPGTKVFMKAGKKLGKLKAVLAGENMSAKMIERCTMEGEKIYGSAEEFPDEAGYYSLVIAKESGEN